MKLKKLSELSPKERVERLKMVKVFSLGGLMLLSLIILAVGLFFVYAYLSLPDYAVSLTIPLRNWFKDWASLLAIGMGFGACWMLFFWNYVDAKAKLKKAKVDYIKSLYPEEIPESEAGYKAVLKEKAPAQNSSEKDLNSASKQ